MSTLSRPRIIVSGTVSWNPNTVNNVPATYDEVNVEPNLDNANITQYPDWLFQTNSDNSDLNGSWNVFGDYKVLFEATVTGVQLLPLGVPDSSDPLINQPVTIGILSTSPSTPSVFARMVDVDPFSPYTTQVIYPIISIGSASVGVSGPGQCRMISRWLNTQRNLGVDPGIGHAAMMGTIWQAALPNASLSWGSGYLSSPVLAALWAELAADPANQGLVFLFTTYCTQYFQSATWQGTSITTIEQLGHAYRTGFTGGNPAVSTLLGRVGIWGPGELATAPTDILLNPQNPVTTATTPVASSPGFGRRGKFMFAEAEQGVLLGPAQVRNEVAFSKVVLDLLVTFPESDATLAKADFGTFTLQAVSADGSSTTPIGSLTYDQYSQQQYESNGGIVEISYAGDSSVADAIANGTLQLVDSSGTVVLEQWPLVSEADQRGAWVDQGQTATMTVTTYQNGATPPEEPVQLLVVPYDANLSRITDASQAVFELLDGNGNPLPLSPVLPVGSDGTTTITVSPLQAGIGSYFLFPFTATEPTPPASIGPVAPNNFFIVLRALPFDNALPQTSDPSWDFIEQQVLSTWDVVYPVMSQYIDLGTESDVTQAQNAAAIIQRLGEDPLTSSQYMPISRDMSAGRKALLVSYLTPFANPAGEKK